jgi:hypothetical protein
MAKVRKGITFKVTHRFLSGLFVEDVHAKRISSLANATLGVVSSASLAVNTIGQQYSRFLASTGTCSRFSPWQQRRR